MTRFGKLKGRRRGYNKQQKRLKHKENFVKFLRATLRYLLTQGILIAIAIAVLAFGIYSGKDRLPELNPFEWKKFKHVVIEGTQKLTVDDVSRIAELDTGMLLSDLDTGLIAEKLRQEALVANVTVFTQFPSKLYVKIQESKPILSAFEAGRWIVFSEQGKELPSATHFAYRYPVAETKTEKDLLKVAEFLKKMKETDEALYNQVSQLAIVQEENAIEVFFTGVRYKTYFSLDLDWNENTFSQYRHMAQSFATELGTAKILDLRFPEFAYIKENKNRRRKNG